MYKECFSPEKKLEIAKKIKKITLCDVELDFADLVNIGENAGNISERCRIGNNVVDFFTFTERLHTKGKYNCNYFEFISNLEEFKKKKFIKNMLKYYENVKNKNKTKNKYIVWKETYNICISAINIFRPIFSMEVYTKYGSERILDFCAGWGGRAIGACALNREKYIGIDINNSLRQPYLEMQKFLKNVSKTDVEMIFEDALKVDYSKLDYDTAFTSPPYYFLEKYENNNEYKTKKEMNEYFYEPIFSITYKYLKIGGYYILNINKEIYESVCINLFGPSHEKFTFKKSKRQNNYKEYVYVWHKTI